MSQTSVKASQEPFKHVEAASESGSKSSDASDTPQPTQPASPPVPPDGGLQAWLQVAGSWCLWFATWGLVNSFGVYQAYYQESILSNESASRISWIGSLQLCLFIASTVVVGPLFDIGFLPHILTVGSFLMVFGLMMTSICKEYWQFMLAQGVCTGLGMGCLFLPSIALTPAYFVKKRALASGIAATGSSLGAIIFVIVFEQMTPRVGFGWATRTIAFLVLASLILPIFVLKKTIPKTPRRALVDTTAFHEPVFWLLSAVAVIVFVGLYIPYFYAEVFSIQKQILVGNHSNLNRYIIVFLNTGSFFGRLLPNILADRIGPFNTIIPISFVMAVIAFCWIAVTDLGGLVTFAVLYGFVSGSFVALTPVIWAATCTNMKLFGTRLGMLSIFMATGLVIGNPIAGALITDNGTNFLPLQAFCGATVITAAVFLLLCRVAKAGPGVKVKV